MPMPGRRATSRCRRPRGSGSSSRRGRPTRRWARSPSRGGRCAGWRPCCCGPTIAPSRSAIPCRSRPSPHPEDGALYMAAQLDGPRLEPRSGAARRLVVFLRGYAADGNDRTEPGRQWQPLLPDPAFVSPHAPEPCAGAPMGRQWFALTFRDPDERWRGVNAAAPILDAFLDAELARRRLPPSALALVGFSQGTMMPLHLGLRPATPPP